MPTSSVSSARLSEPSARPATSAPAPPARRCENLVEASDEARIPPAPSGFSVRGVDASTPVPWKRISAEGFAFAILQASLGPRKNPSFEANWTMAGTCGLRRAAYHFLTPASDGKSQARTFLDTLGDDPGELLPIVDVERSPGCKSACCQLSCGEWSELTASWLKEVEARLGVRPLVYTVEDFWKECLCNKSRFAKRDLWLAGYPRFDAAPRPGFGGWLKWAFYQHKGNVKIGKGVVDLNVFRGSPQDLDRYALRLAR